MKNLASSSDEVCSSHLSSSLPQLHLREDQTPDLSSKSSSNSVQGRKRQKPRYTKKTFAVSNISLQFPPTYHFPQPAFRTHANLWVVELVEQEDIPEWGPGTKVLVTRNPAQKPGLLYLNWRYPDYNRGIVVVANAEGDHGVPSAPSFRCFNGMPVETGYRDHMIVGLFNGYPSELSCEAAMWNTCKYGFKLQEGRVVPATVDDWQFQDFTGIEDDAYMLRKLNDRMAENAVFFDDANSVVAPRSWTRLYALSELPGIMSQYNGWANLPPDCMVAIAPNSKLTESSTTDPKEFVPWYGMGWIVQRVEASGGFEQDFLQEDFENGLVYLVMSQEQAGAFGVALDGYVRHYLHPETGYLANPELATYLNRDTVTLYGDVFKLIGIVWSRHWGGDWPGEFLLNESGYLLRGLGVEPMTPVIATRDQTTLSGKCAP